MCAVSARFSLFDLRIKSLNIGITFTALRTLFLFSLPPRTYFRPNLMQQRVNGNWSLKQFSLFSRASWTFLAFWLLQVLATFLPFHETRWWNKVAERSDVGVKTFSNQARWTAVKPTKSINPSAIKGFFFHLLRQLIEQLRRQNVLSFAEVRRSKLSRNLNERNELITSQSESEMQKTRLLGNLRLGSLQQRQQPWTLQKYQLFPPLHRHPVLGAF